MSALSFKVGDVVIVERRFGFQSLDEPARHSSEKTITRETSTRYVLDGGRMWIKKGTSTVLPRYLDERQDARPKQNAG